jgi:phenylpyruvate tautomerase PptA (4-oxalocrotonate tautomerase family)
MPLVRIETRRTRTPEEKRTLFAAVHRALREAIGIPEHDRQMRLVEHAPENFQVPPGKAENYTLLEIDLFSGRSLDAKRALYRGIVSNLGFLGIAPSEIFILLNEQPQENWGIRGGVAACDIDLGFKVDV